MSATISDPEPLSASDLPTAEEPEVGEIALAGVVLSRVAYWRDGPVHVFRSLDYDVIAADEDKLVAVRKFAETSEDYARFLTDGDGATVDDLQLASSILRRLIDGYNAALAHLVEHRARRRQIVRLLRGRGHDARREWQHRPAART